MKFSVKVFLYTLMVVAIAFSIGGYFLISRNFDSAMDREIGRGSEEYQLLKLSLIHISIQTSANSCYQYTTLLLPSQPYS